MLTDMSGNEIPKHKSTVDTCLNNKRQTNFSIQRIKEEMEEVLGGTLLIKNETESKEELKELVKIALIKDETDSKEKLKELGKVDLIKYETDSKEEFKELGKINLIKDEVDSKGEVKELVKIDLRKALKCHEGVSRNTGVKKEEIYIKFNEIQNIGENELAVQSGSHDVHISESLHEGQKGLPENDGLVPSTLQFYEEDVSIPNDNRCQKAFLESNKQVDINTKKKLYACQGCGELFISKHFFNGHFSSHCSVIEQKHSVCGKTVVLLYPMMNYTEIQKQIEHMCTICLIAFSTASALKIHLDEHCKESTCINCGNSFNSRYDAIIHFQPINLAKNFICNICKQLFSAKSNILSHMFMHCKLNGKAHKHNLRKFICYICTESFSSKSSLSYHISEHNSMTFKAHTKCSLYNHKDKQKLDKKEQEVYKKFSCDICKKLFNSKRSIYQHVRAHYPVETFSCDICNTSFNFKQVLSHHIARHNLVKRFCKREQFVKNLKTYICNCCGKKFAGKNSFSNHMFTHA